MTDTTAGHGPLAGIKVVELGAWVAGPAAGGILADWGASVVKVEPPAGDPARQFQQMLGDILPWNPVFELDNRGKRSVVLDLTSEGGREAMWDLLAGSDVVLTNLRPSSLARLGLDHESVMARCPEIIYGSVTGYGQSGPDRDRPTYDTGAFWSRSGVGSLLTPAGQAPPMPRGGIGDHGVGVALAGGICAALVERARTGRGQHVSTSLLRHGMYTVGYDLNLTLRWGIAPEVTPRSGARNVTSNGYRAADDRWFWLLGIEADRHWPALLAAIERPEWADDPRYATTRARQQHSGELIAELDQIFGARTREEWSKVFDATGLWWEPFQTPEDVLSDPQAHAAGGFVDVPGPGGAIAMVASPVDFDDAPCRPRGMPPELGENTDDVLTDLGYVRTRIDALRDAGAVR